MHYRLLSVCLSLLILLTWNDKLEVLAIDNPTNYPSTKLYNISESDSLACQFSDADTYRWTRFQNGTIVELSTLYALPEQILLQYGEGVYNCTATFSNSSVFSATRDIQFLYSAKNPLLNIQSYSNSPDSIQIDWQTYVDTEPISSYSLQLCSQYLASSEECSREKRDVELSEITTVLDVDMLRFNHALTLTGLLPYHQYSLSLQYSNSHNEWEVNTTARTEAGAPVVDQLKIFVKWIELGELYIEWTSLRAQHTSNLSFTYQISLYKAGKFVIERPVASSSVNRLYLSLDGNTNYDVRLCAENTHGRMCIDTVETGTYQAPEEDILTKIPLILIILLAVLIYFALVIICCLLVALFTKRSKKRRASKNAVGEFELTPPKRTIKLAHRIALFEAERDSGISDNRSHSHTSDEGREVSVELTEARIRNSKIPLRHLKPCLDQHLDNGCQLAKEEFADLRKGLIQEATVGLLPENKKKNRHPNICPYDFNRVRLVESYYINASLIDQDWLTYSYITTQGPLHSTINSFWQMVWEQGSTVIVMLSAEPSPSSCEVYWPQVGDTAVVVAGVDNIHITHDSSQTFGHYIQRNFTLDSPDSDCEKRVVTQLHFTVWPQHSLPIHPHFLWQFITKVHRLHSANAKPYPPLLLHCPDGSEQCGLFLILFELLLDLIMNEPSELNVFELIQRLRAQRTSFIPTAEQYCFIYKALLDQVNRQDTSIQKRNFSLTCKYMNQSMESSSNLYKEHFDSLVLACPEPSPDQLSDARHPINLPKNRYEDQLPNNVFRVLLDIRLTGETSDYINASYIDSFTQRRAFIATQGPLEHTVPQFWSMVFSCNASLIIMLTSLYEDGKEMCTHYWPTGAEMLTIKNLHISLIDELELGPFKQREFLITSGSQNQTVYQLSLPNWSVAGSMPENSDILQLIKHTARLQRSSGVDRPAVVHCDDGVGRTGTFLSIYLVLEQLVYEGVVDIFQTVKGLRVQRPHMVSSLKHFIYSHQTVLEAITKDFTFQ